MQFLLENYNILFNRINLKKEYIFSFKHSYLLSQILRSKSAVFIWHVIVPLISFIPQQLNTKEKKKINECKIDTQLNLKYLH